MLCRFAGCMSDYGGFRLRVRRLRLRDSTIFRRPSDTLLSRILSPWSGCPGPTPFVLSALPSTLIGPGLRSAAGAHAGEYLRLHESSECEKAVP